MAKNSAVEKHELDEFVRFMKEFVSESDRAAVILGAAKLDLLLYQILQRFLVPHVGDSDDLIDGDSPLSSFSAKIRMAYRLSLITNELASALNIVRKIRNAFAHELSGISLDSGAHRDRVMSLVAYFRPYPKFEQFLKDYSPKNTGSSGQFRVAVAVMSLRLEGQFEHIEPISTKKINTATLIPPSWNVDDKIDEGPKPEPAKNMPSATPAK